MRLGKKRVHFGILGAAAVALLAIFLLNGTESITPAERSVNMTPAESISKSEATQEGAVIESATPARGEAENSKQVRVEKSEAPVGAALSNAELQATPYPGGDVAKKDIVARHGNQPLTRNHPNVAQVLEVKKRHTDELMAHPAVVGTAVGLDNDGRVAVVVMTKDDAPDLPRELEGHPVLVWRTGVIASRQAAEAAQGQKVSPRKPGNGKGKPDPDPEPEPEPETPTYQTLLERPVPIGVSTGLPTAYTSREVTRGKRTRTTTYITAGTIGCRVVRGGLTYALSNFHVYAFDGVAPVGATVLQPGTLDGYGVVTEEESFLGSLSEVVEPDPSSSTNRVDGAIALCNISNLGKATLADGYGTPSSTTAPAALGASVEKYGRTTGYTVGTVVVIGSTVHVDYGTGLGVVTFEEQIGIEDGTFSAGGDSGSLIVTSNGKNPVGLLFAGSSTATFANQIDDVLSAFGVTIDGQ